MIHLNSILILRGMAAKAVTCLVGLVLMTAAQAVTIDAVYFGQTHVLKPSDPYFGLVGSREALIKVHVTDPATPASPAVTATLSLGGQTLVLPLTGPATLPASIPDGLGVVQHSYANTFTGILPAAWVKTGLQVTVNAGGVSTTVTNMKVGAPTKVIMTMTDVQYFADTNGNYPGGTFAEVEAKWPVADLEVRRLGHVVFPELVIPPRTDVGTKAERIKSKAEYTAKTGLPFDGEQAAALAWNGALKRAAGRSGRWSLYYLNVYNAFAGGQAGGFAGVGSGTSVGILHHELGHALSLPHWGDNGSYPYKGDMYGIQAPANYNETHAGPAWAFHLPTRAFIPPTTQPGNVGGKPVGTYKVDPMQGGGEGWQEPAYLMNHFSDYSVNQMRSYLQSHVVVWNAALNSWAQWNQTAGDYTTTVSNDGVEFPTVRDTQVISILASISGSDPSVTMVYPPIGPYTAGLIRLFDPTVAADRTAAASIFSPTNGSDLCVRVVQGGVTKTYMLAASWVTSQDPYSSGSLVTEAINLPAADGAVTKIELLLTPNAEDNGLPANPQVLSTWAPLTPEPAAFESAPTAYSSSAIAMKAAPGALAFGYSGTVEYMFTETTGNPGATSSGWQTNRSYTDTGLQAGTQYSYTVSMRAGSLTATTSAAASATTLAAPTVRTATVNSTQQFSLVADLEGFRAVTGLGTFDAGTADKLVVVVSTEDKNNGGVGYVYDIRYNGKLMTEAIQEHGGSANGTAAIFYLDDPGPIGTGTIEVSAELPNGGMGAAYALSNTMAGVAVTNSRSGTAANSVSLTTAGQNSVVIAVLDNAGNNNSAGTPTANAPLTQVSSGSWGSQWGSHASGYQFVATPTAITPTFTTNTGSGYNINIAAAEFPANPPPPNVWTQTAGGAQLWTTASNWEDGVVPSPTNTTTMDFSSVDLLADTNLVLGATRTARIWKFGDASGTQNWTVSAGNTMTLAGTTPTIEVINNTTQLNNVVAGSAGLSKTGAGTLILSGNNTYTSVTRISAGTLVATTLANGGSGNNSSIGASNPVASNLILNGGTLQYTGAAVSTDRLFSLQISSSIDASGAGAVNFTNTGAMGFNSGTAAKTLTLTGANTDANTLAAIIGDNTGATSLTKSGAGTWVLSAANTYTGTTTISGGTLRLANTAAVQDSSQVNINSGSNAGTLQLATDTAFAAFPLIAAGSNAQATIVSDRATAGAGLTHVLGAANLAVNNYNFTSGTNVTSGTGGISLASLNLTGGGTGTTTLNPTTANLTIVGGVTIPSGGITKTLSVGGTSTGNSVGGAISDGIGTLSLTKGNTGIWTLLAANSYTGTTTVARGTLRVGAAGAIPSGPGKGNVVFNTAANTAILDINGFDTLINGLTQASASTTNRVVNNAVSTARTLTVGSNDATSTFAGVITNNTGTGGTLALTKIGNGILTLSGANTYGGNTTVSAGTLALGASNVLPATPVSIGSATLNAATFSDTVGTLDVTGGAVVNLGTGAALAFANSSGIDWTGGTLTITGTFVSGSSLRFGTSSSGLTTAQLARISKPGGGAVALNASGFLIDVPAGSYVLWALTNAGGTTPDQDADFDGVSNGVEYVLGGTLLTDDLAALPSVSTSGGNILFTFERDQASINANTAVTIQVGTTLPVWLNNYVVGADTATSSPGVTVVKGVPAGFDTVTLSVPRAPDLQKFIRLNVTITP